jgi:hypothetical protein
LRIDFANIIALDDLDSDLDPKQTNSNDDSSFLILDAAAVGTRHLSATTHVTTITTRIYILHQAPSQTSPYEHIARD